jgi:HEAT repeat protein
MLPTNAQISIDQAINRLIDSSKSLPKRIIQRFSDLSTADLAYVKKTWEKIPTERRFVLMHSLIDLLKNDNLVNFNDLARFVLGDTDPRCRRAAVELLWDSEDPRLVGIFTRMMQSDADPDVRQAAVVALGQYVYMGDLEELPAEVYEKLTDNLLAVCQGDDTIEIRRHALESLGYSSREEVNTLIEKNLKSDIVLWKVSAMVAIGRSSNERWIPAVIVGLNHPNVEVQFEAVRAAGELQLEESRDNLLELIDNPDTPDETLTAAIWSLSQIGGEGTREALLAMLEKAEDAETVGFIEEALENLDFIEMTSKQLELFELDSEINPLDDDNDDEDDDE